MNRKEWLECYNNEIRWHWYHECEEIRKTLKYNPDPNATHKHHLFNTPEQIEYNNTHYEMWGFNEDGTFEYGKYIVFVTPEEHSKIHSSSEITRHKMSENRKGKCTGEDNPNYGKHLSKETCNKISNSRKGKCTGNEHWLYGKQLPDDIKQRISKTHKEIMTDELKEKISKATKEAMASEEVKKKMSESHIGVYPSNETRNKMSMARKEYFKNNAVSEETRQKLSRALTGKIFSEKHKENLSKSHKKSWTNERRAAHSAAQKIKGEIYRKYKSEVDSDLNWRDFLPVLTGISGKRLLKNLRLYSSYFLFKNDCVNHLD
jgi:hypothetical protein